MKILITGVNGQVGYALMQTLTEYELIPINRQKCDLTKPDQIKQTIDQHQPDLIINPGAFTKVDQAEDEKALAFQINRDAPKVIMEKAREYNIPFIHFSTDYVFDGKKNDSYSEGDATHPLSMYGQSKLAGEDAIQEVGGYFYIFRTSWVYSTIGHNFYLTIQRLSHEREELKIVIDQKGVPTSNIFIAEQIKKIIPQLNEDNTGIYHLVPNGSCSWHEFARAIIVKNSAQFNLEKLQPIQTREFPTKAKRPQNSCLNNIKVKKTFMLEFEDWQKELNKMIDEA